MDWQPDPYIVLMTGAGLLIALVAWLPLALRRLPLSLPVVCLVIGAIVFSLPRIGSDVLPTEYPEVTERLTELVVIIALMGAGLKLDRSFRLADWGITWRLLLITMPLGILLITGLGMGMLGLGLSAALLLAASLAPTDPVLAADVQVGPPREGGEDEVRFALTSEAGLNDGLAFPFVHLAIAISLASVSGTMLAEWFTINVVWEIAAGVACGWFIGHVFGWLTFKVPGSSLAKTGDGLIAIAATFVSYGITELIHAYGFFAVFITALTLRQAHRNHDFQREMHDITEQLERILMMVLLVLFGGALASGMLRDVGWIEVAAALVILLVVRPLTGLLAMIGFKASLSEKLTIAFFGIRGVGSFYYLAYGVNHGEFAEDDQLWTIVSLVVVLSIIIHGLTVTPVMRWLDRLQGRDPDGEEALPPPGAQEEAEQRT